MLIRFHCYVDLLSLIKKSYSFAIVEMVMKEFNQESLTLCFLFNRKRWSFVFVKFSLK